MPWREILWSLRRFEARGLVRGGRFVNGFAGEQYALPEALDLLRHVRRSERKDELVRLSAADPLNLSGVVLAGKAGAGGAHQQPCPAGRAPGRGPGPEATPAAGSPGPHGAKTT